MNVLDVHINGFGFDDQRLVLDPLRFGLNAKEFVCLVGPSGSGKTTLLNLISGLEVLHPSQGYIHGQEAKHIGYMFQSPRLMPWLNAKDNITLVAPTIDNQTSLRADHLLREVGLTSHGGVLANRLSGGMQRRVALARSLMNDPTLLLLDEPFISLDEPLAVQMRHLLLEQYRRAQAAVIFVTHNLSESLFLADRILFFSPSPGRLVLDFKVPLKKTKLGRKNKDIDKIKAQLLRSHPELLGGLLNLSNQSKT